MGLFDGLFRSRDKPQDRTAGSSYTFFMGGSTAGKNVSERSAISFLTLASERLAASPKRIFKATYRFSTKAEGWITQEA